MKEVCSVNTNQIFLLIMVIRKTTEMKGKEAIKQKRYPSPLTLSFPSSFILLPISLPFASFLYPFSLPFLYPFSLPFLCPSSLPFLYPSSLPFLYPFSPPFLYPSSLPFLYPSSLPYNVLSLPDIMSFNASFNLVS